MLALALGLVGASLSLAASGAPRPQPPAGPGDGERAAAPPAVNLPPGVTAGIAVYDRQRGEFTEQHDADRQFRSASVVKLLLALDVLDDLGPGEKVPAADRARLEAMLTSSDDRQASHYWARRGGSQIIQRMVTRLGLTGTAPPPAGYPGYWGYTALTAADTVRVYRHILDDASRAVRDLIMDSLHQATRCAADGYDQGFGIASAFEHPRAVKQGWSGFRSGGCTADTPVTPDAAARAADAPSRSGGAGRAAAEAGGVDLVREALHTTGTVGADDRAIVAVFTLHPNGTSYGTAYSRLTRLASSLNVPGAQRPPGDWYGTWGSGVRVRADATTASAIVTKLPAGVDVLVTCQQRGKRIEVPPYSSEWWAYLPQYGGYLTNVYVDTPHERLPGVPECG
nr:hypothetical protein [Streptomyces sp. JJ66]